MVRGMIQRSLFTGLAAFAVAFGSLGALPAAAAEQANVSVVLIPQADTADRNDGVDTYRVVVTNQGAGEVKGVTVTLPFNNDYRLAGASFDRNNAWVSRTGATSIDLRVEQMRGSRDSVSGTLRFVGDATPTNAVVERATVTWSGDTRSPQNASNLPVLLQEGSVGAATVPGNRPGYSFSATAFASNEPVSLWYTSASGTSTPLLVLDGVALPEPQADDEDRTYGTALPTNAQGQLQALIDLRGVSPGTYTIAAQGGWSGTTAFATLIVR